MAKMKTGGILPFANAIAYIATLAVNYLAVALPIGGETTAQIATQYPIYFLPANITFSIWGLIYLGLGAFTVQQFRASVRQEARIQRIGWLFVASSVFNCAWLITFQSRAFALSMVAMVALLLVLIAIYTRLEIGRLPQSGGPSRIVRLTVDAPFSVYLGWISVATIANASYVLYDARWNGFGISGQAWAVIMLVVATLLTLVMLATRRDIAFALVVVWAFAGIAARQQASAPTVGTTAEVLGALVVLALLLRAILPRKPGAALVGR